MSDERLSLPSASSRARDSRCPGALNLIRELRAAGVELEPVKKVWTVTGTRIHAASAGEELDLEHTETLALETVQSRLGWLQEALGVPPGTEEIVERRLWLRDGLRRIASGQPDRIWRIGKTSVIPDIKTGWGDVEGEDTNLQFRAYAVLEYVNRGDVEEVIVATISAHGKKPMPVRYDAEALTLALHEWLAEIEACNKPDAPRIAGAVQCNYCPAKLHCDKAQASIPKVAALTIHESGLVVTNEQIAALLDRCGLAKKMIGEIEAEAKRRLEADPECLPIEGGGKWGLKPGRVDHPITQLRVVLARCMERGVSAETFTEAATVTKTKLTDMLGAALGLKGKALKAVVDEVLRGAAEDKQSAPSLKRIEAGASGSTPPVEDAKPKSEPHKHESFTLEPGEIKEANTYVGVTGADGLDFKKACKFWAGIRAKHGLPESVEMRYDEATGIVTPEGAQS